MDRVDAKIQAPLNVWGPTMKMIIEAHLVDDNEQTEQVRLATIDRELSTDPLGMNLAE